MKTQKHIQPKNGYAAALIVFVYLFFFLVIAVSWGINIIKLISCDFEAPFKDEIIHAIGIIPFAAPFTVWF